VACMRIRLGEDDRMAYLSVASGVPLLFSPLQELFPALSLIFEPLLGYVEPDEFGADDAKRNPQQEG
jgi:hypothetical protein